MAYVDAKVPAARKVNQPICISVTRAALRMFSVPVRAHRVFKIQRQQAETRSGLTTPVNSSQSFYADPRGFGVSAPLPANVITLQRSARFIVLDVAEPRAHRPADHFHRPNRGRAVF